MTTVESSHGPSDTNVRAFQTYATHVGRLAEALAKDGGLAQRVIVAGQGNQPAEVQRLFEEVGVSSKVTITGADGAPAETPGGAHPMLKGNVTVTIGIGPVSISFHCECSSGK
jgi:hypothetical protein